MALESELKFLDVNLGRLSGLLKKKEGAEFLGRYFETNQVYDYPDRSLKKKGVLLRLREKQGKAVLTVKRPPEVMKPTIFKVFEEFETMVGDFDTMQTMLEAVGFAKAFAYEKVREKWRFMECTICLDTLPYGDFAEIEGTAETLPACAYELGLDLNETTKATYHMLNIEYRHANELPPDENFVFDADRREAILKELGKD